MALKLSEGDEMVRVSKKTGKQVCVVHNELFRPPMIEARKLVKEGKIGKVLGMEWVRFTHKDEYLTKQNHWIHKLPGGLIGEVGPHAVYASLAFLKTIKDVEITAKNILKYPWAPFDYFNIIFEGEEITSSVIISMASNNFIADVNVFGTDATLRLDLQKMSLIQQKLNTTKPYALAVSSFKSADQIVSNVMSNAAKMAFTKAAKGRVIGHATEIEQYVDSIINNQSHGNASAKTQPKVPTHIQTTTIIQIINNIVVEEKNYENSIRKRDRILFKEPLAVAEGHKCFFSPYSTFHDAGFRFSGFPEGTKQNAMV
jgi:predicted dehydrogenase